MPVDSSLSVDDVMAGIADEAPGDLDGPRRLLEPFNPQLATSYWPRWKVILLACRITQLRALDTKNFICLGYSRKNYDMS